MNLRIKPLDDILANAERKSLKRSLGAFQLTMMGIGAIIGTGIFVLTAEAAQKAGPGMMISFVIAGFVCAVAALCYAELSSMVPVSGSAYTYSYAVLGEVIAWLVGWALVLEFAVAASAVSVGWSNYFVGNIERVLDIELADTLTKGLYAGGLINLPAAIIAMLVTALLVIGTRESATVNAFLVCIKVAALILFVVLAVPVISGENFEPFAPNGFLDSGGLGIGVAGAAASIFFAYVGFDAVATAAEETKNPQRNIPIGLIGSLAVCTVFYLLVAAGAVGAIGAQPVADASGVPLSPGSEAFFAACAQEANRNLLACSDEPLAHVLDMIGWGKIAQLIALAAFLALPSVILMMLFGQTRIFFVMARDGLLPFGETLSKVHPKYGTPYVVTLITGAAVTVFAAFFPVGVLADISNSGTLFAFLTVAVGVMVLRRREPNRPRPFRTPVIWLVGPLALSGCAFLLFSLPLRTQLTFLMWTGAGLLVYLAYGYRKSPLAKSGS
ncbi:MAG: amino acid permease [Gammaproteobacteria bacterium]|nr:amino acid permease [Gammaproteobacteria bacterium]